MMENLKHNQRIHENIVTKLISEISDLNKLKSALIVVQNTLDAEKSGLEYIVSDLNFNTNKVEVCVWNVNLYVNVYLVFRF